MATLSKHSGSGIIVATFAIALILAVIPLPSWLVLLRPEWVALFLIYWCIALPERVGVGAAWLSGLLLDVTRGTLLGQHALAMCAIAYLALLLHQRIRVYPLWQQSLSVLVLLTLYQLLILWINGIIGRPPSDWTYWLPSLSSSLLWTPTFVVLRAVRREFGVR